jgi:hypothetical protein
MRAFLHFLLPSDSMWRHALIHSADAFLAMTRRRMRRKRVTRDVIEEE